VRRHYIKPPLRPAFGKTFVKCEFFVKSIKKSLTICLWCYWLIFSYTCHALLIHLPPDTHIFNVPHSPAPHNSLKHHSINPTNPDLAENHVRSSPVCLPFDVITPRFFNKERVFKILDILRDGRGRYFGFVHALKRVLKLVRIGQRPYCR